MPKPFDGSRTGAAGRTSWVYADGLRRPRWRIEPGFRFFDAGGGKNAADLLLCIDAMEFTLSGNVDTFILASGDGDFTHLVLRLRERGLTVIGVGVAGASRALMGCRNRFEVVDTGVIADDRSGNVSTPAEAAPFDLDSEVARIVRRHGRGIEITALSNEMKSKHGVRIGVRPEKNWRCYLTARPALFDVDPRGPAARVRLSGSA